MLTTVVAITALVLAVAALILAAVVMHQNANTTTDLRRHRRAHADAYGYSDPKLDRRQVNVGAPRSTGERRGARRYEPDPDRLAPRPPDDEPATVVVDVPAGAVTITDHDGTTLWRRPPDVPVDEPTTAELDRTHPPTALIEQQRPGPEARR